LPDNVWSDFAADIAYLQGDFVDRTLYTRVNEQIHAQEKSWKKTVQNILALRIANPIFEPVWNRNYIDHIVITVAEILGVEHRAGYYEHAGALRDMVQNHLLQLLCLVAMEPPAVYDADNIRNRKMDIMHAL
jgi:glucose-6-phosphate 1-dehydrogenase